jgi:50S ribosomal subunit-associated GTPase HflX
LKGKKRTSKPSGFLFFYGVGFSGVGEKKREIYKVLITRRIKKRKSKREFFLPFGLIISPLTD